MKRKRAYSNAMLPSLYAFVTFRLSAFLFGLAFLCGCAASNSEYDDLMAGGDYHKAKRLIHRLLDEYSYRDWNATMPARRAQLYYWLANAHAKLGEYDSLQLALSLCVSSDPGFGEARDRLLSEAAQTECDKAVASYNAGEYDEAMAKWKTALDLIAPIADGPFQARIHRYLGFGRTATNDTARAIHHFKQSSDLGDPISQNLMLAYQRTGILSPPTSIPPLKDNSSSIGNSPAPPSGGQKPQIQKGMYSVSGSISLSSGSSDFLNGTEKSTSFQFAPSLALFVLDRLELTFAPTIATTSSEIAVPNQPSNSSTSTALGIGLAVRYYFPLETLAPFVGAGGGLSWSKITFSDFSRPYSPPTKTYNIAVGFDYFLV